jgi:hypothetical protein
MRKLTLCAALTLFCGGCATEPPAPLVAAAPPDCREITTTATIDGKPQEVKGFACRATDGTWQLAAPMAEPPVLLAPPYEYAWYDPLWGWWWPASVGVDPGFFFFGPGHGERFRHFARDHDFIQRDHHHMRG